MCYSHGHVPSYRGQAAYTRQCCTRRQTDRRLRLRLQHANPNASGAHRPAVDLAKKLLIGRLTKLRFRDSLLWSLPCTR
jgi:hypothetical protein